MSPVISTVQEIEKDEKKLTVFEHQQAARAERYALQTVAKDLLPNERVSACLRNVVADFVQVHKHRMTGKAFYNGLMTCGSVWNCPVCAAKVSEKRKGELLQATTAHKASGGFLAMLTLTVRHKRKDELAGLLKAFNDSVEYTFKRKEFTAMRQEIGLIGRVKALEITHGFNGWHPHAHIVIFYENKVALKALEGRIYKLWSAACKKFGLSTTREHGIDLQGADQVEAYLVKQGSNWSIEQEMTKSHIKKGRGGSMTPFDLLRDVLENDDDYSKALFVEYAKAFKGKRQLHWSRGLKDLFGINEKSDEELAKEKTELADLLAAIPKEFWYREIARKGLRAQLLTNIELCGFELGLKMTLNLS